VEAGLGVAAVAAESQEARAAPEESWQVERAAAAAALALAGRGVIAAAATAAAAAAAAARAVGQVAEATGAVARGE